MEFMMVCASHSPILDFPARESASVRNVLATLKLQRERIAAFAPELVILFGVDHYGGHQMHCMPSFCVGIEATALADVGGTPGPLNIPRELAVQAVKSIRRQGVDTAVSYAMEVDHGFSQALQRLTGGVAVYPVLPIFMCCLQPPLSPYGRARALGEAVGKFARSLSHKRVLFIGTGGLAHNPVRLFPPVDAVSKRWRPYILHGKTQSQVSQQAWIDYEIASHRTVAKVLGSGLLPRKLAGLHDAWDKAFLEKICSGDLVAFDAWDPDEVMAEAGIGAVETQSWVAAAAAMQVATGAVPRKVFQEVSMELGIGFGVVEAGPTAGL